MFPSSSSPAELWHDLAPVSSLASLKELQLVGYTPTKFTHGAATGAGRDMVMAVVVLVVMSAVVVVVVVVVAAGLEGNAWHRCICFPACQHTTACVLAPSLPSIPPPSLCLFSPACLPQQQSPVLLPACLPSPAYTTTPYTCAVTSQYPTPALS